MKRQGRKNPAGSLNLCKEGRTRNLQPWRPSQTVVYHSQIVGSGTRSPKA